VVTTVPLRIVDASFGPVLLTKRQIKDGCHACVGAIGIYYLKETGRGFVVKRRWPTAIEGWGWGLAPNWSLTDRFTENPAIYSGGGYTGQGLTCMSATITELAPGGPVESVVVRTGLSNVGMLTPDSTEKRVELGGRIAAVQKDRSFEVRVTGTDRFTEHYVKRGGKFVFANGESRLGC